MKKIFKHMLILAAAALGFAACQEELADVQGVTGDFAYIVGGTEAKYVGITCDILHTPNLVAGEVSSTITIALTKPQTTDVEVSLTTDDSVVEEGYFAFPAGVLEYPKKVTIPAGEKTKVVEVTTQKSQLSKLTNPKYQAIFRIATASVVQVSTNSNAAYLTVVTGTSNLNPAANTINVNSSTSVYDVKHYHAENGSVNTVKADITKSVTVNGSENALLPFKVSFAHDASLVEAYNTANGTTYLQLPSEVNVSFEPAKMQKDAKSATATISISPTEQHLLSDSRGYLVPIVVADAADATIAENCGVTYLVVTVKNIEGSAEYFSALYLGDYRMSTWYMFNKSISMSNGYTYIFHMFIDEFDTDGKMRVCNFSDANENWINMIRIGETPKTLEWFVGPNGCRFKLYTPELEAGRWYQVALKYTRDNKFELLLEKQVVATHSLTADEKTALKACSGYPPTFQALEFNSSYGENYREGSAFQGRLWYVSAWSSAISNSYITNYAYRTMNSAFITSTRYGLQAFWKMDEGDGPVCAETTGRFEAIDFTNTMRCDDETNMVSADVSQYVHWKNDSANFF